MGSVDAPAQQASQPITVRQVTALFRSHIAEKYADSKKELNRNNKICDEIDADFGDIVASEFGPVRLKTYRATLVSRGLARNYVTPRCRMNAIASKLYGQIRRGHLDSVNELLTKFAVEGLSIPPPADQTMSPRDLEKLRLDQWVFMKALIEKLGNQQLQFADELDAIQRIPNPGPKLTNIRISEDGRLATTYTVPGSLEIELKFVKENGKWLLDGANRPDYYELIPKLKVISK